MKILMILFAFLFVGCVTAPTPDQMRNADYGTYPSDYENTIKNHMATRLKDPGSATYNFGGTPRTMWAGGGLSGPVEFGYGVCAHINAKNSFGGYVGAKQYFFLIKNERVVREQEVDFLSKNPCL